MNTHRAQSGDELRTHDPFDRTVSADIVQCPSGRKRKPPAPCALSDPRRRVTELLGDRAGKGSILNPGVRRALQMKLFRDLQR